MNGLLGGAVELYGHEPRDNPLLTAALLAGVAVLCCAWVVLRWRAGGKQRLTMRADSRCP